MRIYEELFIVDPNAAEDAVDGVVKQVEEVVKDAAGSIDKVEKWGVRKLAYLIDRRSEGFYVLVQFRANAKAVREIERRLRVEELVLKYLTVRIDEKLKWLEKRKQVREKRAARRPQPAAAAPLLPGEPVAAPGMPGQGREEKSSAGLEERNG